MSRSDILVSFLSEGTVKVYLARLFQKLGGKDRFELALCGLKNMTVAEGVTEPAQPQVTQPPRKNPGCVQLIHANTL